MKIILTGASGYLGSKLATELLESGYDVFLLLRHSSKLGRFDCKAFNLKCGRYVTDADIADFVTEIRPDIVIHTACSYGRTDETPLQMYDANLRFGLSILQALDELQSPATFINSGTVLQPDINLYALTKNQFSTIGRALSLRSDSAIRFINVSLQHMYGPGDDTSKFTTYVMHGCQSSIPEILLTAGEQQRDLIYIDDVVSAFVTIAENHHQFEITENIEVGTGAAPTIRTFVETVHRLTNSATKLQFGALPYREKEAMLCIADITKMRSLGWRPQYDIEAGIAKAIEEDFAQ